MPTTSGTVGTPSAEIAQLREAIWGTDPKPGTNACKTSPAGGRSYFLPEKSLQMALEMAALRGVRVRIILPGKNNMPFVNWAAFHILGGMLECGVEVYLSGGSFVHSKLFVVDDYYAQVGSFNLDARSLKLNFEVAVESFSEEVAAPLVAHFEASVSESSLLTSDKLARRSALQRFNGALFWLMSPYL